MIVEVAFLPAVLREVHRKVVIVVDALRASSTILTLFQRGAPRVMLAADRDAAFALAATVQPRPWLCGESGGLPIAGFDFGNSPSRLSSAALLGRLVVLCTSNGTAALAALGAAPAVFVGTGRNCSSVARRALVVAEERGLDVAVLCAGDERGSLFSLEDAFFAGLVVERIARLRAASWPVDEARPRGGDPSVCVLDESAVAARRLVASFVSGSTPGYGWPDQEDVRAMFLEARNGHTLPRLGYAEDLALCARIDDVALVPRLDRADGQLVLRVDG
ncbi:MAG: 2-phosphosulfolactate phosphatase [Chloroflexi bacterium]|nr:2-phosphosulfolactate phosphatase [Chloroflexota bacterium]